MVVMDRLKREGWSEDVREQVEKSIGELYDQGLVFGNLAYIKLFFFRREGVSGSISTGQARSAKCDTPVVSRRLRVGRRGPSP